MALLLQEPAPEDPEEMWQLLGRINEVLELSRFALIRAHEGSTIFELIDLRRQMGRRRIQLFGRLKETSFRWK